jgi:hypothetical protein
MRMDQGVKFKSFEIKSVLKQHNFHKCDNSRFSQSEFQIYGEDMGC